MIILQIMILLEKKIVITYFYQFIQHYDTS